MKFGIHSNRILDLRSWDPREPIPGLTKKNKNFAITALREYSVFILWLIDHKWKQFLWTLFLKSEPILKKNQKWKHFREEIRISFKSAEWLKLWKLEMSSTFQLFFTIHSCCQNSSKAEWFWPNFAVANILEGKSRDNLEEQTSPCWFPLISFLMRKIKENTKIWNAWMNYFLVRLSRI